MDVGYKVFFRDEQGNLYACPEDWLKPVASTQCVITENDIRLLAEAVLPPPKANVLKLSPTPNNDGFQWEMVSWRHP
ncbi:hypothetical protein FY534_07725 [Alicyclobacillus sp. TC]|uniref:Uncharacterized protein n=1 Tax=Alicyclobacillus tolerans TaxID=90970 RepID=A0ABT9LZQ2_9BACL|nr:MULTISPECIES: hypothetical protein [Alicyclobacillus]MDP9729606.1 hypothetical protein [Alicyclobacillus tengchongensis]QRF23570.1 hypothetical protein FY534_07725 [Alicyclobacillus sp. TC]